MAFVRRSLVDLPRLLDDGYSVADIRSSPDQIAVVLAKGDLRITLALGREDAAEILGTPGFLEAR